MFHGLLNLSLWGYIGAALLLTHITIISVTVYLHRHQTHQALSLHPWVSHFFRFWLWLTTSMTTKEWVAIHRKHHAKCETEEDPHSPHTKGIATVLFKGAFLYHKESQNKQTIATYGRGTPDDWIERRLYSRYSTLGIVIMGLLDILLFGAAGIVIFAVQMLWIPLWAAGVVNGIGHYWGYRNFETKDASTNIISWGILIGGEELHNNHHAYPASAKLSSKRWEFDIGWAYIRLLEGFRLAKVARVAPRIGIRREKNSIDLDTVSAVVQNRFHILKAYGNKVISPVCKTITLDAGDTRKMELKKVRKWLIREDTRLGMAWESIEKVLQHNSALQTVYRFKQQLKEIWSKAAYDNAKRIQALQTWCAEAEQSNIRALREFASYLRGYAVIG